MAPFACAIFRVRFDGLRSRPNFCRDSVRRIVCVASPIAILASASSLPLGELRGTIKTLKKSVIVGGGVGHGVTGGAGRGIQCVGCTDMKNCEL